MPELLQSCLLLVCGANACVLWSLTFVAGQATSLASLGVDLEKLPDQLGCLVLGLDGSVTEVRQTCGNYCVQASRHMLCTVVWGARGCSRNSHCSNIVRDAEGATRVCEVVLHCAPAHAHRCSRTAGHIVCRMRALCWPTRSTSPWESRTFGA